MLLFLCMESFSNIVMALILMLLLAHPSHQANMPMETMSTSSHPLSPSIPSSSASTSSPSSSSSSLSTSMPLHRKIPRSSSRIYNASFHEVPSGPNPISNR
ncbi:hypothetical protein AMTRI_Chr07g24570 [Amborella trichopoda]|uniref:Uncharacterized protein n=1 Tax=Amborella trichopoda TaxID=13333 RepID=U5D8N6_AMBTC|nr:hypothetical protein AMTR_s00067p00127770 [Amborella trichopoda]